MDVNCVHGFNALLDLLTEFLYFSWHLNSMKDQLGNFYVIWRAVHSLVHILAATLRYTSQCRKMASKQ
jgi:hypothetical protein